jgi:hypothetical protein
MPTIEPSEIPWCEDCGASLEFCECNKGNYWEEEIDD